MAGGILQLTYVGEQNIYLTCNPEITFFRTIYKRHTNFSLETCIEAFDSMANFGKKARCIVPKKGDMLKNLTLNVRLPSLNNNGSQFLYGWANTIGHVIVEYTELYIGGVLIDKQYGEWLEIWVELTQPAEKRSGYNEMVGKKEPHYFAVSSFSGAMELYIPMNFYFCRNVGLAIPIISLQYCQIEFHVKFRDLDQCWVSDQACPPSPTGIQLDATILIDYIYLDLSERHKFAQGSHLYLIEQTQSTFKSFDTNIGNPKIDLDFNHPIKQLVWVIQRNDVIDKANGLQVINNVTYPKGNDWFNYSVCQIPWLAERESYDSSSIQFDSEDRVISFPAKYYRLYIPYQYQTRIPTNYIYTYNFAMKPEELQPTGTCNWSRIDTSQILLKMNFLGKEKYKYTIKVYATNYNWLLITGGMAGLLFEN